jgi:hypothetical protein
VTVDKIIHHRVGTISLVGDIYYLDIKEDADITLDDAKELVAIGTELTKGRRVGALVRGHSSFSDTNEARTYFAEKTADNQFVAVAIIASSLAQRLITNFYININRPNVPTRMFMEEKDAIAWLREILDSN